MGRKEGVPGCLRLSFYISKDGVNDFYLFLNTGIRIFFPSSGAIFCPLFQSSLSTLLEIHLHYKFHVDKRLADNNYCFKLSAEICPNNGTIPMLDDFAIAQPRKLIVKPFGVNGKRWSSMKVKQW